MKATRNDVPRTENLKSCFHTIPQLESCLNTGKPEDSVKFRKIPSKWAIYFRPFIGGLYISTRLQRSSHSSPNPWKQTMGSPTLNPSMFTVIRVPLATLASPSQGWRSHLHVTNCSLRRILVTTHGCRKLPKRKSIVNF